MTLPQQRNKKKYRRRKFNPMVGRRVFRLSDTEPERPFSLDEPPRNFEDMLNEKPAFEQWLDDIENERILQEPAAFDVDDDDMDFDDAALEI